MTSKSAPMTDTETIDWPTPEMLKAGMDDLGWWVEPYAAVDSHMSAEDAAKINAMQMEVVESAFRAMLAAAPQPLSASPKGDDLEPVAWMHPTLSWVHMRRDQVAPHCRKDGPQPVPLVPASRLQSLKAERDALASRLKEESHEAFLGRNKVGQQKTLMLEAAEAINQTLARAEAAEAENATLKREIAELREAARHIMPYLAFTIGDESPGYHPTMPSAVDAFKEAFATQGGK